MTHENGGLPRPINILEILGNAIVGGMENYVRNLLAHLPPREFQVTVLAPFESPLTSYLRARDFDVYVTPMPEDPPLRSLQTAVSLIREHDIHLIHAHLANAQALAGLAGCLARRPVVATLHGMHLMSHELGIYRLAGGHLIVVCQQGYNYARSLGVASRDLTLIYNGVDAGHFVPAQDGAAFRQHLAIPASVPLVGFVGRLAPEKGPDLFVRAASLAAQRHPEAHFVLVGAGPLEEELRALIGSLPGSERIQLAGLWPDTAAVYPAFDLLAQTSRMEGTPLALLEAMSCALPTVTLGVGGVIEIVEVGATGLVYGPGDWEGVAHGIITLLNDPALARRMGEAARRRVLSGFTVQASVEKTAGLFRRLAARDRYRQLTLPEAQQSG